MAVGRNRSARGSRTHGALREKKYWRREKKVEIWEDSRARGYKNANLIGYIVKYCGMIYRAEQNFILHQFNKSQNSQHTGKNNEHALNHLHTDK